MHPSIMPERLARPLYPADATAPSRLSGTLAAASADHLVYLW